MHPEDLKIVQAAFMESAYFGRAGTAEVRLKHRDKSYVWAEIRCRPTASLKGAAAEIVGVTRDISQRKAQEQALIEARDHGMVPSLAAPTATPAQKEHSL